MMFIRFSSEPSFMERVLALCRSSICDRPRTYDKFYQRGPSNYYDPSRPPDSLGCSSDTEDALDGPHIPSVDGTSSQRCLRRKRKKGGKNSGLQYSRTITENDVRTIERHLSMKKTIRLVGGHNSNLKKTPM